jgi:hypothetical protein
MFDKLIRELIIPASEMAAEDYFIGFTNLIIDSITEFYHLLKQKQDKNVNQGIRARQAILKNSMIQELLVNLVSDSIQL